MNILIVDDTSINIKSAQMFIEKSEIQCNIYTNKDPFKTFDIIDSKNIDILILDIMMPGLSGLEILKNIRSDRKYKDIQIIMYTAVIDKEVLKECFDIGANDYVTKPIEPIEFISRIKAAIKVYSYNRTLKDTLDIIKERNVELKRLTYELKNAKDYMVQKEKSVAIGELAAGIAHEINNPLGFISSNFEILNKYIIKFKEVCNKFEEINKITDDSDKETIIEKINEINKFKKKNDFDFILEDTKDLLLESRDGIDRVSKIVKVLKKFSHKSIEEYTQNNINSIIEEILLILKYEIKYKAKLTTELNDIPLYMCNEVEVQQAFLNIIKNAVEEVSTKEDGYINIKTYFDEEYIYCEIRDNGKGVDDDIKSQIFNPFYTTKDVGEGMGLGLSISNDIIVNKYNGYIEVASNENKGTVFTMKLHR